MIRGIKHILKAHPDSEIRILPTLDSDLMHSDKSVIIVIESGTHKIRMKLQLDDPQIDNLLIELSNEHSRFLKDEV